MAAYPVLSHSQGSAVQMTQISSSSVVTTQPLSPPPVTNVVVVNQPAHPTFASWNTSLCDCCSDLKSCCCVYWCNNFYYACVATRMGENCCVGCSGDDAGCIPGGHIAMRTKLRIKHNIQGDICEDCMVMHFCKPCAMCQIAREMNHQGYPQGTC